MARKDTTSRDGEVDEGLSDPKPDPAPVEAEAPPPVVFNAPDRYHAITYLAQGLPHVAAELKAKVTAALTGLTGHQGAVHVAIPPAPPTPGIVHADAVGDDDFAVTPIHFVKV